MKDNKIVVAFDVGGTLTKFDGVSELMVRMAKALDATPGFHVIFWTAGDVDSAQHIKEQMGLNGIQVMKKTDDIYPDIVFDDDSTQGRGLVNCIVTHAVSGPVIKRGGE